MSIYVMAPALRAYVPDVETVPGTDCGCDGRTMKLVLLGLADSANEDGTDAHPGVRALADYAQCHTDTIVRALRGLEHLGAIVRTESGGPGRKARYRVVLGWLVAQAEAPRARHARKDHARATRAKRAGPPAQERARQTRAGTSTTSSTSAPAPVDDQPIAMPESVRSAIAVTGRKTWMQL